MAENIREIVLDTLLALERREAEFSNQLIKAVLDKYDYLDNRDKSFIKRVTEGSIERQIELDYYLNSYSSVPVKKMKPLIRCLLRMSVYQLLYMDAVPDSAVCNEACRLAEKRKFRNLKGFMNGVLRKISREKEHLPKPDPQENPAAYYSVLYSCPEWLTAKWLDEYGTAVTARMLEGLLHIHPVSLRFHSALSGEERENQVRILAAQGTLLTQSHYLPYVYQAENLDNLANQRGFTEGCYTVQDVSSALAVEAAGIAEGDFVMDICAAPGGKTLLAAEKAGTSGKVLARDVSEYKLMRIQENQERMRAGNVSLELWDATQFDTGYDKAADVLLMDVPCSGLGIMGKKRDIKYHVTPESLEEIVTLQRSIIENSWRYVKPGGILLYSTCTIHHKENEENVRWILEHLPFEPAPLEAEVFELLRRERRTAGLYIEKEDAVADCQQQLLPGIHTADGFYFARLRRKEG